jgi:hypothetical protein
MRPAGATNRFVAFFVVAFLCLNAGAFLCLSHCAKPALARADHCPLKKASGSHCPHSEQPTTDPNDESFAGVSITCCMLPVGVFGAPLELKGGTITSAAVPAAVDIADFAGQGSAVSRQLPKFYYRPPPNDTRFERVRNQVFRI